MICLDHYFRKNRCLVTGLQKENNSYSLRGLLHKESTYIGKFLLKEVKRMDQILKLRIWFLPQGLYVHFNKTILGRFYFHTFVKIAVLNNVTL
jgi:hypothetical protein